MEHQIPVTQNSPKLMFWFGIMTGVAHISLVGFFALLTKVIGSNSNTAKTATTNTTQPTTAGTTDTTGTDTTLPTGTVPAVTDTDHIKGGSDPAVYLVEYSDYECPFCKSYHPSIQQALEDYGDQIAVVYRQFPLSIHPNAQKAAESSECIAELGGNDDFWAFTDAVFTGSTTKGTTVDLANLAPVAKDLGVNESKFTECVTSGKYAAKISEHLTAGANAGVNGTPTTFVMTPDGSARTVSGAVPYVQLKTAIDAALAA